MTCFKDKKLILFLIAVAVLIRFYCISLPSFSIDMNTFKAWSQKLVDVGPTQFYQAGYFSDYFPGYLYILLFLGKTFSLFGGLIFSLDFEHYLKFFTNLFDFGTAYFIYKIIKKYRSNLALEAAFLYLINPALIFNSSTWGQVDGVIAFFLIYTSYTLLETKKLFNWNILGGLSFIVKPQGIAAFPAMFIKLFKDFKPINLLYLFLIPATAVLVSLPFFPNDPILGLFHLFLRSSSVYPYNSMFAYNFWSLIGWWISDANKFFGLSYNLWGYGLFVFFLSLILIPLILKSTKQKTDLVYLSIALSIMAFFLFLTRIHERYLFHFFAFFLIFVMLQKRLLFQVIYMVLALVHFINLWYVYYYYNFVFNNGTYAKLPIYVFLTNYYFLFSVLSLALFFYLLFVYYLRIFNIRKIDQ